MSTDQDSVNRLRAEPSIIGNVRKAVIGDPEKGLEKVEDYTTFLAEYVFYEGDMIVHFFQTKELARANPQKRDRYWLQLFPVALSDTAEDHFQATLPRIFAEYVPEMTSWYFKARGFANKLDPKEFLYSFFGKLDTNLDRIVNSM